MRHANWVIGKSFKGVFLQRYGQVYLFPRATVTNYHSLDGLKQQKFILSPIWKPEVQNQGVGWTALPLEALEENPS